VVGYKLFRGTCLLHPEDHSFNFHYNENLRSHLHTPVCYLWYKILWLENSSAFKVWILFAIIWRNLQTM